MLEQEEQEYRINLILKDELAKNFFNALIKEMEETKTPISTVQLARNLIEQALISKLSKNTEVFFQQKLITLDEHHQSFSLYFDAEDLRTLMNQGFNLTQHPTVNVTIEL